MLPSTIKDQLSEYVLANPNLTDFQKILNVALKSLYVDKSIRAKYQNGFLYLFLEASRKNMSKLSLENELEKLQFQKNYIEAVVNVYEREFDALRKFHQEQSKDLLLHVHDLDIRGDYVLGSQSMLKRNEPLYLVKMNGDTDDFIFEANVEQLQDLQTHMLDALAQIKISK